VSNVLDIHIQRSVVGSDIPFDKLYLFSREDREHIPKIFGYALVLPFSEDIQKVIYKLKVAEVTHKSFQRDDSQKKVQVTLEGNRVLRDAIQDWWEAFALEHDLANRVAVVPVLTSVARKKIRPRYIASQKWFADQEKQNVKRAKRGRTRLPQAGPALSELAYLATPLAAPQDKIRPLCSICPRMLMHLQGDCVPGQAVCYTALNFAEIEETQPDVSV
jgi:hypothetical protein